jgi:hypothetical protein
MSDATLEQHGAEWAKPQGVQESKHGASAERQWLVTEKSQ